MSTHATTRTLIADDHAILRNAVKTLLAGIPGVAVVGEADNGLSAIALAKTLQPDLLVLDVSMPHAGGVAVLEEVRRWSPKTRIAILTAASTPAALAALRDGGAVGVLLKSCAAEEIERGLRAIVAGEKYFAQEAQRILAQGSVLSQLTARERQVLSLAVAGRSNAEVAAMLCISPKTAENHRTNLMRKLDVHSAAELAALAVREGLLDG